MTTTAIDTGSAPTAFDRAMILGTLTMVTMLYAMTVTIANVSLPQMQGSLSATTDQIALVVTFNIIATAVATPMTGWLAARFSRRAILIWGVIGFTCASLACGLATSLEGLVLFRVLQGAFGAPLVPLSQAIVMDSYPREKQASAMAVFGMGVVVGKGVDGAGPRGLWPWESVGGMTATPDGIEGKVEGSSNFGVSWAGCES